ncbi:uncharacterized protein PAN0_002d0949 [Moesziomyces antarcticus]|uniref:uncharacterized protein n=1 Tax=Pseudozyma antarctica TaxID=84753 RepID=UPI0007198A75|nr:uncharacterized protein PAN0_002d0949 [Moesziomyces antarcticus]GAK62747.1 hypothetical protein PAN0_002d0949 [Moesziomyces antarcticus]
MPRRQARVGWERSMVVMLCSVATAHAAVEIAASSRMNASAVRHEIDRILDRTQRSGAYTGVSRRSCSRTQQHPARNSPTLSPLSRRPHTLPEERKSDAIRVRLSTSSFHLHPIPIPIHTPPASSSSSPPTPRVSSTTSADLNPSASSRLITNAASPCFRLACPPIHRRRAALPLARSCGPPHLRPAHAVSVYLATPPNLQHMHFRFS